MFSQQKLYGLTGYLILGGIAFILFAGPILRGVIYPTEKAIFGMAILILWSLQQWRGWLKNRKALQLKEWESFDVKLATLALVVAGISAYINGNHDSLIRYADYISLFLFYLLVRTSFLRRKRRQKFLSFIILLGVFHSILGYVYLLDLLPHPWWEKPNFLSGTFVNHNHYAGLLELTFFLSFGRLLANRQEGLIVNFLYLAVLWIALLLSLSRGAWVSVSITLFIAGFLLVGDRSLRALGLRIIGVLIIGIFIVGVYVFSEINPALTARFASFGTKQGQFEFIDFRIKLWQSTIAAIEDRPLLGHGPGAFEWAMRPYRRKGFEFAFDYAHNDWLQFGMECGLVFIFIGLIYFVFFFGRMLRKLRSQKLSFFRFEEFGLGLGVLCILIHGVVDFNLHILSNAILFMTFLALGITEVTERSQVSSV